jgi:UPF0271 protein
MNKRIDLNCDMGESFGAYMLGQDEAMMDYVSSVNIACGFHAGDALVMRRTVALAAQKGLAIGAHPGYPDLQGFGRRPMQMDADEVYAIVLYQVGALRVFAEAAGSRLNHVKPHGALYNAAAKNRALASAIARAVRDAGGDLLLTGLSGSCLIDEGRQHGLRTISEVFADRTYQDDGTLTPRSDANALISSTTMAIQQVLQMVHEGTVTSVSGITVPVEAQTVCIHGDGAHALTFARSLAEQLHQHHVSIKQP